MNINLNQKISVTLTASGLAILLDHCISNKIKMDEYYGIKGKKNCYGFILWEFMSIFGNGLYNGCEALTKNNEITLEGEIKNLVKDVTDLVKANAYDLKAVNLVLSLENYLGD